MSIELTITQKEMAAGARAVQRHERGRQLDAWEKHGLIVVNFIDDDGIHMVVARLKHTTIRTVHDKDFPNEVFIANIALAINAGQAGEPRLVQSAEADQEYLKAERKRLDELRKHVAKW